MIEIIRRQQNIWAGEQNVCFGQSIMYIIPSGFPSVLESIIFLVELYFSYIFTRNLTGYEPGCSKIKTHYQRFLNRFPSKQNNPSKWVILPGTRILRIAQVTPRIWLYMPMSILKSRKSSKTRSTTHHR
jgi:hypothetical protein